MKKTTLIYILLIVALFPLCLWSQEKPMISYTEDDGLANNDVRDVNKDLQGYLWIATGNGLSKFDGDKFVNFHTSDGLPGNMVWAVAHDEKNRKYVACYRSGLAIMENDKVIKVLHINGKKNDRIRKLYYSNQHHLLFLGTDYGIYALKDTTFNLLSYPNCPDGQSSILAILENDGVIYFTDYPDISQHNNGGLFRIDINDKEIQKSKVTKIISNQCAFAVTALNHSVYTNCGYDIYQYLPEDKTIEIIAKTDSLYLTWAMSPITGNKILLGGAGEEAFLSGIKTLDTSTHQISSISAGSETSYVQNLISDEHEGQVWVCTESGLKCLNESPFEIYTNIDKSKIIDISVIHDSLFVLTSDNIWLYKDGVQKILYDKKYLFKKIKERSNAYSLEVREGVELNQEFIKNRFFEKDIKLISFNSDGERNNLVTYLGSLSFPDLKSYLPIRTSNFITNDTGGLFWSPKYHNLEYFPSIKTSSSYHEFSINKPVKDIVKIIKSKGTIFLASIFNGLYAIKGNIILQINSSNSRLDDMLSDLESDNNGEIWCISKTGNLFHVGLKDSLTIIQTFNHQNSKIIGEDYKWIKFIKNYLYLGTNKGLNKIPISQLQNSSIDSVFFYNKNNGYEYISADSPRSDNQGNIYVFNQDKVIKISDNITQIPQRNIVFTEVRFDNKLGQINLLNNRKLPGFIKNIRVIFKILKLPNSNNIRYRYRINESEWNDGNTISLQSLKSGNYKISCEAKDLETSMVYSDSLAFKIDKPIWLSWWFLLLFLIALTTIIYLTIHVRFERIAQRKEEKASLTREIAELHIQSLQSQMNPHFIFNSLNSIQNFILSNKIKDAVNYLATLGSLIRINLEHVSEEYISLTDEITFLEQFIKIEKLRFKDVLNVSFNCNITNTDKLFIPPMLIQPLIENSIKYGSSSGKQVRSIQVEFSLDQDLLIASVTDNGIGRDRSMAEISHDHKSFGLKLIKERLELLNKKNNTSKFQIIITDLYKKEEPIGTKVQIIAPQYNQKQS